MELAAAAGAGVRAYGAPSPLTLTRRRGGCLQILANAPPGRRKMDEYDGRGNLAD